MNMATKNTIYQEHLGSYRKSSKAEKSNILNAVCRVVGVPRKSAIRRFNALLKRSLSWKDKRGGTEVYDMAVMLALKDVWKLSGGICAERIKDKIPEYVHQLRCAHEWKHAIETTQLLFQMSLGTLKNRIGAFDKPFGRKGLSTTNTSGIREIIPVRRGPWNNPLPGFGEIDTVAHCGSDLRGDYCFTVQYTDVATIWTCLAGQWNKGEKATKDSIIGIQKRLPFQLLGLDPDSGGEFINWHLLEWAQRQTPQVILTRTRPYMKNDHARIEQKNYVNVRKWTAYERFDHPDDVTLLSELYAALEDYINFFIPSVKCIRKIRHLRKRTQRVYDAPQTAYERVLAHQEINPIVKKRLKAKYATLSMVKLKCSIDQLTKKLFSRKRTALR